MFFYLPEGLDLSFLPPLRRPAAEWFLHKLFIQKTHRKLKKNDFIKMHSKILIRFMGAPHYVKIIKSLIKHGIILKSANYVKGKHSYGYRLTDSFCCRKHHRLEVTNKPLMKKIIKRQTEREYFWSDIHFWLKMNMKNHLTITSQSFKHKEDMLSVQRIIDGDFFASVCQYGRFHTNITNLRKSLRNDLRLDGKKIVEMDISNSQPLMLFILAKDFISNKGKLSGINAYPVSKQHQDSIVDNTPPLCLHFCEEYNCIKNNKEDANSLPDDLCLYGTLCETGRLYEHLMTLMEVNSNKRNKFKKDCFKKIFYCRNEHQNNKWSKLFENEFPSVMQVIKELKKKDYRHAPQLMQRVESDFMIHRVCGRIKNEYPDMRIITIHDSILSAGANMAIIKKIMEEEFSKMGVYPKLKEPRWFPSDDEIKPLVYLMKEN